MFQGMALDERYLFARRFVISIIFEFSRLGDTTDNTDLDC